MAERRLIHNVEFEAHLNDADDAHDASAISVDDAGGFYAADDVEGVLQELPTLFSSAGVSLGRIVAIANGNVGF